MKALTLSDPERRCRCGHLLAVLYADGLEIKCRRCKRIEKVSLEDLADLFKDRGLLSPEPSMGRAGGDPCGCSILRKETS